MEEAQPTAEAVAVADGKILFVGSAEDAKAYADANVASEVAVKLTNIQLNGDEKALNNYELVVHEIDLAGEIIKRPLSVTADNKTATYGSSAPAFTVSYSGWAGSDNASNSLTGGPTFDCDYTAAAGDPNRNVGTYTITPSGITSGNYELTYHTGTLTVTSKALTVATVLGKNRVVYGQEGLPSINYAITGFVYGENADVVTTRAAGKLVTYDNPVTTVTSGPEAGLVNKEAGTYDITPITTNMQSENNNYRFVASAAALTVAKYPLKINGITVDGKYYDGTTSVAISAINLSGISYDGLLTADKAHIASNPGIAVKATGQYHDKNVGTNKTVDLVIELDSYLTNRCYILTKDTQKTYDYCSMGTSCNRERNQCICSLRHNCTCIH